MESQLALQLGGQTVNQLECQLLVMSGRSMARDSLMQRRKEITPEGEPSFTRTREIREGNGELIQNIPDVMCEDLGLEPGMTLTVEMYDNGFFVHVPEDE